MRSTVTSQQAAEVFQPNLTRKEIARKLGISEATLRRRLDKAGIKPPLVQAPWTDAELAIVRHRAFTDETRAETVMALQPLLPGRKPGAIEAKLADIRAALGSTRRGRRIKGEPPPLVTRIDPPRPGTYRDSRGITLKALSFMEARI